VTDYLKKKKVKVLDWPGNSPDLNPIENLWEEMKNKVADQHPTSLETLKNAIKLVWTREISKEYCSNLVESMPSRLTEVIKNKGGHTKY
jgi:transposase